MLTIILVMYIKNNSMLRNNTCLQSYNRLDYKKKSIGNKRNWRNIINIMINVVYKD